MAAQWAGPDATEPSDYWLSTLPPDTRLEDLVRNAKARWRIEGDYRELQTALGLDHFEGRSWSHWGEGLKRCSRGAARSPDDALRSLADEIEIVPKQYDPGQAAIVPTDDGSDTTDLLDHFPTVDVSIKAVVVGA